MAKNTNYHRADVTLLQSENARLKEENAALAAQVKELKRKLEHMTEVFANASVRSSGSPARRGGMSWAKTSCACSTRRRRYRIIKRRSLRKQTSQSRRTPGRKSGRLTR